MQTALTIPESWEKRNERKEGTADRYVERRIYKRCFNINFVGIVLINKETTIGGRKPV